MFVWKNIPILLVNTKDSFVNFWIKRVLKLDRVKRIWYLSPMRAAKVQASLRIRAVSPEPSLLAHTSSESRGTFRQKARSLAPLNGWACAVQICHDGMLEDTNSLDGAQLIFACYFRFVKGFKYRNEVECDENMDFIQYTKINFLERLKKSCPRTVLDKSWVKAPRLLEEVHW